MKPSLHLLPRHRGRHWLLRTSRILWNPYTPCNGEENLPNQCQTYRRLPHSVSCPNPTSLRLHLKVKPRLLVHPLLPTTALQTVSDQVHPLITHLQSQLPLPQPQANRPSHVLSQYVGCPSLLPHPARGGQVMGPTDIQRLSAVRRQACRGVPSGSVMTRADLQQRPGLGRTPKDRQGRLRSRRRRSQWYSKRNGHDGGV